MSKDSAIRLSGDEALVLFEFFSRFHDTEDFMLRYTAEYLAFSQISAQLDKALVEPSSQSMWSCIGQIESVLLPVMRG